MAFANIIRRTAYQCVPFAIRAVGSQRSFHNCSTLLFALNQGNLSGRLFRRSLPSAFHRYSTNSEDSLIRVIESEIKYAQESDEGQVEEVPAGFPFKIEDKPGQQTISLTRSYQGETIEVEVHMPDLITGNERNEESHSDDDSEQSTQSNIPLVVRVSKHQGPCLEFGCTAYPDEVSIDSLSITDPNSSEDQIAYEGPDFGDLDENLQKAFHKYLEIRGIKPSTTNFLHEYMINKDSKEYLMWLKNLKKFIEA